MSDLIPNPNAAFGARQSIGSRTLDAFGPWRVRPIFISSTFRDMHAERDWLRDRVFPELEERLKRHRHHLESIDLRQGVETTSLADDESRELKILKVCLAEVDRSRPYLIVLLGDRYGWKAPPERIEAAALEAGFSAEVTGKSVTALEIEFGVLEKHPGQRRCCYFYFRDPLPYDRLSPQAAAEFSDAHASDPDAPARQSALESLKARIQKDPELGSRVHHYQVKWNSESNRVLGLEAWGQKVLEDLWSDLEAETREFALAPPPTWQTQERAALGEFIEHRLRGFTGRDETIRKLLDVSLSQIDLVTAVCLTGGPGTGKSSVFAKVFRKLQAEQSVFVLAHAAGSTPSSRSVDAMLRRWIDELAALLRLKLDLPDDAPPHEVQKTFESLLRQSAQQGHVVVLLVDALNQFEKTTRAKFVTWFDPQRWPSNVRIIVTTTVGHESKSFCRKAGIEALDVPSLNLDEAYGIGNAVWRRYHRECNSRVFEIVLARKDRTGEPAYVNPLWLTLAMEQLNLLDADDFTRAGEQVLDLLLMEAAHLPGEVEGLYGSILVRAEKLYGARRARHFACLLALGRQGWREADFAQLMPLVARVFFQNSGDSPDSWDPLEFAILRRGLRAHILQRGAERQWDFFHDKAREAVFRHYLADAGLVRRLHRAIADHLLQLPELDPLHLSETMFHLMAGDDRWRAAHYYAHVAQPGEATRTIADGLLADSSDHAFAWTTSLLIQNDLDTATIHSLCHRFLFDLHDAVKDRVPLVVRFRLLDEVGKTLQQLASADSSNISLQSDLSVSHSKVGDVLRAGGDLSGARTAYQNSLTILRWLATARSPVGNLQHDLAVGHERLGDVLSAQGDLAAASVQYRASIAIIERLATADPSNLGRQYDLSVGHTKLGVVFCNQGDLAGAWAAYQVALSIRRRLAAADPSNVTWQRGLSVSYSKLGDVLRDQGDLGSAFAAYRDSLAIAERLAASDPFNTQWQQDLSIGYNQLGYVARVQGDLAGASAAYHASLTIRRRLAAADPSNADWQGDLFVSYIKLGDVLLAQGNLAAALPAYRDAGGIAERLVTMDPSNTQSQRYLCISNSKVGDLFREQGDLAAALNAYRESLSVARRLAEADLSNTEWQRDVSVSHVKLGDILCDQGDLAGALDAYRDSFEIAQRLASADSSNSVWQHGLSTNYNRVGDVLRAQGDLVGALTAYQHSLAIAQQLAAADPSNAEWQGGLSLSLTKVGDVRRGQGDLAGATTAYHDSHRIRQRLAANDPFNPDRQRDLASNCLVLAEISEQLGSSEASQWWLKAYETFSLMLQRGLFLSAQDQRVLDRVRQRLTFHSRR